jgi:hypothetical protein
MPRSMTSRQEAIDDLKDLLWELLYSRDEDGVCPKCYSIFERPEHVPNDHPGYFCPECRNRGYAMLGIVHFKSDSQLNILPPDVTTV